MKNKNLYKGTLESLIFQLLRVNNRMYGYEISKTIKQLTNNEMHISESKLYPTLHKLEADGMLEVEVESTGTRLRKYYKLTEKGVKESQTYLEELKKYIFSLSNFVELKIS
ncbi:MAG: PadR family transcriptional regulator [Bacteroidetes bacterium]|nr:MAG: PadR family transcriptional regulator [Bacteroidota bacterium]